MENRYTTITTRDLSLVAALATMGISFSEKPEAITSKGRDGQIRTNYTFYLNSASEDGRFETKELIAAWYDDEWENENPEHPFCYIKLSFRNRESLLDLAKQFKQLMVVESKGKIRLMPKNISDEKAKVLLSL